MASSSSAHTVSANQCVFCGGAEDKGTHCFLECLHSCCEQCASHAEGGTLTCPNCKSVTKIGEGGCGLVHNYLQDALEHYRQLMELKRCVMCKGSGENTIGTLVCAQCDNAFLCTECLKKHRSLCPTHTPKALEDELTSSPGGKRLLTLMHTLSPCPKHGEKLKLDRYCKPCQMLICKECSASSHQGPGHETMAVADVTSDMEQQMLSFTEARGCLQESVGKLTKQRMTLVSQEEDMKNRVAEKVAALKRSLNDTLSQIEQDYRQQISTFYAKRATHFDQETEKLNSKLDTMNTASSIVQATLDICPDDEVARHYPFLTNKLQQLQQESHTQERPKPDKDLTLLNPIRDIGREILVDALGALREEGASQSAHRDLDEATSHGKVALPAPILSTDTTWHIVGQAEVEQFDAITSLDMAVGGSILVAGIVQQQYSPCLVQFNAEGHQELTTIPHNVRAPWQLKIFGQHVYISNREDGTIHMRKGSGPWEVLDFNIQPQTNMGLEVTGNTCYFTDSKNNLIYSTSDCDIRRHAVWVGKDGKLSEPHHLCLTPSGNLVVSNQKAHKLVVFNKQADVKFVYGTGTKGSKDGQLSSPHGISSDNSGYIYVADRDNHRVTLVSHKGKFVQHIAGEDQQIFLPHCVKVTPRGDKLVIAHSKNKLMFLEAAN